MSYGRPTEEQQEVIRRYVEGKHVHDLGAGFCELSLSLLGLGAAKVTAVDKVRPEHLLSPLYRSVRDRFEFVQARFEDLHLTPEVALVSWPINHISPDLFRLVFASKTVVYLGNNTGMSCCAWPGFYHGMLKRELLAYLPNRQSSLIVYGGHLTKERQPCGEEKAGMDHDNLWTFEDIHGSPV